MKNICIYYIMGEEFVVPLAYTYCYVDSNMILFDKYETRYKYCYVDSNMILFDTMDD